jgi:urease accessory protein
VTRSDLLIVNKIDLASAVGGSLEVMRREAGQVRQGRPVLFTNLRKADGLPAVVEWVRAQLGR